MLDSVTLATTFMAFILLMAISSVFDMAPCASHPWNIVNIGESSWMLYRLLGTTQVSLNTSCENYAVVPSFSSISPYLSKTSCPRHNVKLHNYALMITTTTLGTCLWSRYPVLVIICELEY